ncbi:MAG TPA: 50S ribosomal protein L11 methyltransferase [Acidimicrobiales bacterium]|nr:50S ribosomal protein L11 methyltransferase [Acidimicrobiales bacterium]
MTSEPTSPTPGWFTVAVSTPVDGAELVADVLWTFEPAAVEERPGAPGPRAEPTVVVRTGFADRWVAEAAAEAVTSRGWGRVEVTAVVDDGLAGWRAHARVEDAPPFAVVPAWLDRDETSATVDGLIGPARIVLALDPGSTFGSGSHPTTRLVLTRLATLVTTGVRVLDVGCGSGVLAVGAALLGAEAVGIDVDPSSDRATRANAERNGVADRVRFDARPLADLATDCRAGSPRFEVVAANLLAPVIDELADDLSDVVAAGGSIVVSGLLADRWPTGVGPLVAANRMGVEAVDEEAGWVAVTLRRHPDPVGLHPVPTLP